MSDAFIFYRLDSNNTDQVSIPDPTSTGNPTFEGQKLYFTLPDEVLDGVNMIYENNIKDAPVSNPDGTRQINKQDNGLMRIEYVFRGRFRDPSSDSLLLQNFAKRLQVESTGTTNALGFGIFGFWTTNTSVRPFNLDPDKDQGLTIRSFRIVRDTQKPKNFDFEINMTFGGTF